MTGRSKRRSFVPGRRESLQPEVFTQDPEKEEEERKARNRQRKQDQHAVDSPGGPGGSGSHSNRRSIGGNTGMTNEQLSEHYSTCIKLSAENKISTKNAFNLQLIDHMATMIKKKESDMNNFQLAAGTLDASTKIYAFRVDAVYGDTLKIASGLGQTSKQNDEVNPADQGEEGEDVENQENDPENKKTKKRFKKSATIEKNLKNISVTKFELEFEVDPLFTKTKAQYDSTSGGNQFLATLNIRDETCELLLDSGTTLESIHSERDLAGDVEMLEIELPSIQSSLICPTFSNFLFNGWSVDKEDDPDDAYDKLNESINLNNSQNKDACNAGDENAFDQFADPEPIDNIGDDVGMGDYDDEMMEGDGSGDQHSQWSEKAAGMAAFPDMLRRGVTANLPMTPADMLNVLTSAPLEYSYFDSGKMGAWAGPKHWKFKPLMRTAIVDVDKAKGRKKKLVERLNYLELDEEIDNDLEAKVEEMLNAPKKSVKLIDKTMKGWSRERSTLPEDLHYSGHELVRLKVVNGMVVARTMSKESNLQVDDAVDDYNYDNAADNEDYCPDMEDDDDAYCDAPMGDDVMMNGDDIPATQEEDFAGGNLVEAPKLVDKAALQIGYAKTAKKVDMKRIKNTTWSILTHASRQASTTEASPEKMRENETEGKVEEVEEMVFSELFKQLKMPSKLPPKQSEGLSVPLAFIALLHLCNERNLELLPSPKMDDFGIKQG